MIEQDEKTTTEQQPTALDDRYLWPEMLRVVSEARPAWVIGENVAGIVKLALDDVLADLENEGYSTETFIIPACAVGARHRRDRTWIVARNTDSVLGHKGSIKEMETWKNTKSTRIHSNVPDTTGNGFNGSEITGSIRKTNDNSAEGTNKSRDTKRCGGLRADVANTDGAGCEKQWISKPDEKKYKTAKRRGWWTVEPDVGRVAHGIPKRVDRLRSLGNAIVPQVVYPIMQAIKEIGRTDE